MNEAHSCRIPGPKKRPPGSKRVVARNTEAWGYAEFFGFRRANRGCADRRRLFSGHDVIASHTQDLGIPGCALRAGRAGITEPEVQAVSRISSGDVALALGRRIQPKGNLSGATEPTVELTEGAGVIMEAGGNAHSPLHC